MSKNSSWNLYSEGMELNWKFSFSGSDMDSFIKLSKDDSPIHTSTRFANGMGFSSPLIHGALLSTQLSRLIGKELPDSNAMTVGFSISFSSPAYVNDELDFKAQLRHKSESTKLLEFKFLISRAEVVVGRGVITAKWLGDWTSSE